MLRVWRVGAFHLWPVTKVQFKQYMADNDRYGDEWYESVCSVNEAVSPEAFIEDNYERLFMTGVFPGEALDFARWLGEGFDLPTAAEWKKLYNAVSSQVFNFRLSQYALSAPALTLREKFSGFLRTPLAFSFLQEGVVEWVKEQGNYVGCGSPRDSFFPNAWHPPNDVIRAIDSSERIFYFGFRLIKRSSEADKKIFATDGRG
jgi:formylglycine-generating enzyme required for sulfatase activity